MIYKCILFIRFIVIQLYNSKSKSIKMYVTFLLLGNNSNITIAMVKQIAKMRIMNVLNLLIHNM